MQIPMVMVITFPTTAGLPEGGKSQRETGRADDTLKPKPWTGFASDWNLTEEEA